jgi:hypothetical protein
VKKVLAPALCLVAALFLVLPVAARSGWPYSHEYLAPFERVEAFRRAFRAFDFFPTWTPFCFNGHGTPSPLIYHRLFNWVGGLLAVPLGTDLGVRVALVFFAWLGAWGLFRVARRLEISPPISFALAAIFIWAPYSLTDWLVRGSTAEFASMMVLPWLLEALVRQIQGEAVWKSLGLSLAAILHAHQSVGLFLAMLPVLSTAMVLTRPAKGTRRGALVDALWAAGLAMVLTLPWLVPVLRVGGAFHLDSLKIYVPWGQYSAWQRYIADDTFAWGHQFQGFSVELSRGLLGVTVLASGLSIVAGAKTRQPRALLFLALAFLGASLLQFDVSTPLYQKVPNAELLQFPWRLLGALTPLACLILGVVLEALAAQRGVWRVIAVGLAFSVALAHARQVRTAQLVAYPRYTSDRMTEEFVTRLDGPWSASEYLPKAVEVTPPRSAWVDVQGCVAKSITPAAPRHFRHLDVELEAGPACRVTFSQFASPLLVVEGDGARVEAALFITVEVPAGGARVVSLRRKNLLELWWP